MDNLTVVIPYRNGGDTIGRLLETLPAELPVIIVDDQSRSPIRTGDLPIRNAIQVQRSDKRRYFSGAVNDGIDLCSTDVLVLNQDIWFTSNAWIERLNNLRRDFAVIGDGVLKHPTWPKGYVQGTFMFMRRDALDAVGGFNETEYPLWGSTCEWQLRACRQDYRIHASHEWRQWMGHEGRHKNGNQIGRRQRLGQSISEAIRQEPDKRQLFLRTPPAISVIMPCYNYGHYLADAVNSLIGGKTSLGDMPGQTFQSFEIVIVDDASTDDSWPAVQEIADDWKGIRGIHLTRNRGTPGAINAGIAASYGEYIHILSADDMREPWGLQTLYDACRDNPHSVAYGNIRIFANGERKRSLKLPEYDFNLVLQKNPMPAGIMYERQAWDDVGGYPEEMIYGREDWAFNIRLGAAGYCGIHVGDSGNLYRREKQNRSLRTGNVHKNEHGGGFQWRQVFMQQLEALYPELYRGERPMGCCGGRGKKAVKPQTLKAQVIQTDGMVWIRYVGGNAGNLGYWGTVTRTKYVFGGQRTVGQVHAADYDNLINLRVKRRKVFEPYTHTMPTVPQAQKEVANPTIVFDRVATKRAQEVARELGINLVDVVGTGKDGKIMVGDVRGHAKQ